jgi:hypothetical protein
LMLMESSKQRAATSEPSSVGEQQQQVPVISPVLPVSRLRHTVWSLAHHTVCSARPNIHTISI